MPGARAEHPSPASERPPCDPKSRRPVVEVTRGQAPRSSVTACKHDRRRIFADCILRHYVQQSRDVPEGHVRQTVVFIDEGRSELVADPKVQSNIGCGFPVVLEEASPCGLAQVCVLRANRSALLNRKAEQKARKCISSIISRCGAGSSRREVRVEPEVSARRENLDN